MILIWDNGDDSSEHEICFVEIEPGEDTEQVERYLDACCRYFDDDGRARGGVIGKAEHIHWYKGGTISFSQWLGDFSWPYPHAHVVALSATTTEFQSWVWNRFSDTARERIAKAQAEAE